MSRADALSAIASAGLPPAAAACLRAFAAGKAPSPLRRELKKDPAAFCGRFRTLLADAGRALGTGAGEVLFATGFDPANLAPERFEAALAELRAAVFLKEEGFSAIRQLPVQKSRTADLAARRDGAAYAFEVRRVAAGLDGEGAVRLLAGKFRKKLPQAALSRRRDGCSRCGVVFVSGLRDLGPFAAVPALRALAAGVHAAAGSPAGVHVCVLAGAGSGFYPAWGA